jgi:hypothetical protein
MVGGYVRAPVGLAGTRREIARALRGWELTSGRTREDEDERMMNK